MKRTLDLLARVLFYISLIALLITLASTMFSVYCFDADKLNEMIIAKNIFGANVFVFFTTFFPSIALIKYNNKKESK